MKNGWKRAALGVASAAMALALAGCTLPLPTGGFADYDVSGYFQALLDSSYKGNNTAYVNVTAVSEEEAQKNNTTTVQNAAINFCNTYGVLPNDEQLSQLEEVMRQALVQADYTVKDEEKVESGYTLEVEVDPIVNFSDLEDEIEKLREEAEEEATQAHTQYSSSRDEDEDTDSDGYGYGDEDSDSYGYGDEDSDSYGYGDEDSDSYGYGDEDSDSSDDSYGYDDEDSDSSEDGYDYGIDDSESSTSSDGNVVDANAIFVDKVVSLCQEQLSDLRFSGETVTVTLEIRQTDEGELQLDTNQLDTIDRTVLQFQKSN